MSVEIAGRKTIDDWNALKAKIDADFDNNELWNEAYSFLEERINHRYIYPAKTIQDSPNSRIIGEGFSIVTILCSVIEALETFYQGKYFTPSAPKNKYEYTFGESKELFVSFFTKRWPFKKEFNEDLSKDFYSNVRCGLLHEAASRNGWRIRIDNDVLIEKNGKGKILNRVLFLQAIIDFMEQYKSELLKSKVRKEAFVRKMDSICNTA